MIDYSICIHVKSPDFRRSLRILYPISPMQETKYPDFQGILWIYVLPVFQFKKKTCFYSSYDLAQANGFVHILLKLH